VGGGSNKDVKTLLKNITGYPKANLSVKEKISSTVTGMNPAQN